MAGKKLSGVYVSWPRTTFSEAVKTNKNYKSNFQAAMLYAHYEISAIELKKEVVKYLKHLNAKNPLLDKIKDIHENRFITVGKYMYILNHGGDIPENVSHTLMPALEKIIDKELAKASATSIDPVPAEVIEINTPVKVMSIQDRIKERARETAGEIEGWLDDFCIDKKSQIKSVDDFVNLYKTYDLKAPHMRYMQSFFERRTTEIREAVNSTDKDTIEAYSNFTKPELKKFLAIHENLMKACDMLQEVAKVERAPRKKKPISQDKIVSKLKFKKEDNSLGIVSVNPIQIIGAKDVWCFDTKKRKITRYITDDVHGPMSVKGTTIIGYNMSKSVSKTLRKPVEQLAAFKKCSKVQLRTFMDTITTVGIAPGGRINEDILIVRVDR